MKKLKLRALELGAKEVLTREQLKMVLGGDFGGSGSGSGSGKGSGSKCSGKQCGGHWVGGGSGHWEYGTCGYQSGIGNLPGGCFCSIGGQAC